MYSNFLGLLISINAQRQVDSRIIIDTEAYFQVKADCRIRLTGLFDRHEPYPHSIDYDSELENHSDISYNGLSSEGDPGMF